MINKNFAPWKRVREFTPEALLQESSELEQLSLIHISEPTRRTPIS